MSKSGSKIREQVAHFLVDIHSKNQYMYFDAERYVGNDFKRTYNLRAGLNWKL
jgi:hypothetical protein